VDAVERVELLQKVDELKAQRNTLREEYTAKDAQKKAIDEEKTQIQKKDVSCALSRCQNSVDMKVGGIADREKRTPTRVHKVAGIAGQNR
jgi:FtsZ-binding cell division protein ZapB